MESLRKHRNIKLVTIEWRRSYLVSEPNHHTTEFFTENLLAILMNKQVYLSLSKLDLSKTVMFEFWYDYVKPKYGEMENLDTHSINVHVKTNDISKNIAEDIETRFDTSNNELDRPCLNEKVKK